MEVLQTKLRFGTRKTVLEGQRNFRSGAGGDVEGAVVLQEEQKLCVWFCRGLGSSVSVAEAVQMVPQLLLRLRRGISRSEGTSKGYGRKSSSEVPNVNFGQGAPTNVSKGSESSTNHTTHL